MSDKEAYWLTRYHQALTDIRCEGNAVGYPYCTGVRLDGDFSMDQLELIIKEYRKFRSKVEP